MTNSCLDMCARAESSLTTPSELELLSNSIFAMVRRRVALNPNTPDDLLRKWGKNISPSIRSAVAINRSTPVDVLVELAEDKDWEVRMAVAENDNLPIDELVKLSNDADEDVREHAMKELVRRREAGGGKI